MGLKEILGSIDLKDLAMGMAVASQGDTAVPDVMKVLEQRRLEQDRKNQQGLTNEFLYDAYNQLSGGSNPVPGILQKERQINTMPETVPQYDTAGVTTPQPVGVTGLDEATTNVSNQAKAQASADFIIEAQEISKKMPNWADGVAYLRNKYRDKPVDSQLVSSALSSLYGKREAQILKGMEIADRQQAREDTAKTKEEDRKSKITTGFKAGEPYMEGGVMKVAPGEKAEKEFAPTEASLQLEFQRALAAGDTKKANVIGETLKKMHSERIDIAIKSRPPRENKPDKPEYSPKQALTRISVINGTIAKMKEKGSADEGVVRQNPMLEGILDVDVKDPEAIRKAIISLELERDYVSQFAPKGTIAPPKPVSTPAKPQNKEWKKWVK
jgi:hypothetical protein